MLAEPEHVWQLVAPGLAEGHSHTAAFARIVLRASLPFASAYAYAHRPRRSAGRDRAADTQACVGDALVGTGGVGKTLRVALQAGADSLDVSGDGVWLVELASASDAGLVASTIASTLGLREQPDRSVLGTLLHYLKNKRLLLILDNCEHVIDEVARIADAIMRACHDVRLLATSREPLRIDGEYVYRLPSLAFPPQSDTLAVADALGYGAIALFVQRAAASGCEVWADRRERADRCGDLPTPRRHRAGD